MYTLLRKIYISEVYDISPQCENLRIFPSQRFFKKKKNWQCDKIKHYIFANSAMRNCRLSKFHVNS